MKNFLRGIYRKFFAVEIRKYVFCMVIRKKSIEAKTGVFAS